MGNCRRLGELSFLTSWFRTCLRHRLRHMMPCTIEMNQITEPLTGFS